MVLYAILELNTVPILWFQYCSTILITSYAIFVASLFSFGFFYQIVNSYEYNCSIIFCVLVKPGLSDGLAFGIYSLEKPDRWVIPSSRRLLNSLMHIVFNILSDIVNIFFGILLTAPLYVGFIFFLILGFLLSSFVVSRRRNCFLWSLLVLFSILM